MAIVFDGPVPVDALTTFVRQVPTPADQILNRILPDRYLNRNSVDFGEILQTNRAARFRAYDGRLHVSSRDSGSSKTVKLPPLSSSLSVGELERLQLEFARTGGTNTSAIVQAVYNDATQLTHEVQSRMELARGDVLTDGKFTMLANNGEPVMEADYGVPGGNLVAPATIWSTTATATIVADMRAWVATYVTVNGFRPGGFVTSERVLGYMLQNAEIRALASSLAGTPAMVGQTQLESVLGNFRLPPLMFTYDTSVDVDGVPTRAIPDDRVLFLPPAGQELGGTYWGVSATALELVNSNESDATFEDAPGIVGVVEKVGPPYREFTFVDAVGMPVLSAPKRLMVADVL